MKTKIQILNFLFIAIIALLIIATSCKKKDDNNSNTANGTVTDINGNVYHTVKIGTQTWMLENLRTTKFNDGNAIPLVIDSTMWNNLTTSGYCWYNNEKNIYEKTYGALYNWFAVKSGKLCPAGWHVPTYSDWELLINFLGSVSIAGGKMKNIGTIEAGTGLWYAPNEGASNESGFSGLPGGYRYYSGNFMNSLGHQGFWWSSTEYDISYSWGINLYSSNSMASITYGDKRYGFSVRCIKTIKY